MIAECRVSRLRLSRLSDPPFLILGGYASRSLEA